MLPVGPDGPAAHVIYRLPTAGDLIAFQDMSDAAAVRRALADRCILEATWGGVEPYRPSELPDDGAGGPGGRDERPRSAGRGAAGPDLPGVRREWQALFDIAAYFWAELAAEAKRLLREVDALARAYGWREADILALSPRRRQAYLELIWTS